jgi:hypothetical protein
LDLHVHPEDFGGLGLVPGLTGAFFGNFFFGAGFTGPLPGGLAPD